MHVYDLCWNEIPLPRISRFLGERELFNLVTRMSFALFQMVNIDGNNTTLYSYTSSKTKHGPRVMYSNVNSLNVKRI